MYTTESEMSIGNPKQNEFAQETKSSESKFHTQENLLQSKNQNSSKVGRQYSTSSTITKQKIIVDSDDVRLYCVQ